MITLNSVLKEPGKARNVPVKFLRPQNNFAKPQTPYPSSGHVQGVSELPPQNPFRGPLSL